MAKLLPILVVTLLGSVFYFVLFQPPSDSNRQTNEKKIPTKTSSGVAASKSMPDPDSIEGDEPSKPKAPPSSSAPKHEADYSTLQGYSQQQILNTYQSSFKEWGDHSRSIFIKFLKLTKRHNNIEFINYLIGELKSPDKNTVKRSTKLLSYTGSTVGLKAIVDNLDTQSSPEINQYGLEKIADFKLDAGSDKEASETISSLILESETETPSTTKALLYLLARNGTPSTIEALIHIWRHGPPATRPLTEDSFQHIYKKSAVPPLANCLQQETSPQRNCLIGLISIGNPGALEPFINQITQGRLEVSSAISLLDNLNNLKGIQFLSTVKIVSKPELAKSLNSYSQKRLKQVAPK